MKTDADSNSETLLFTCRYILKISLTKNAVKTSNSTQYFVLQLERGNYQKRRKMPIRSVSIRLRFEFRNFRLWRDNANQSATKLSVRNRYVTWRTIFIFPSKNSVGVFSLYILVTVKFPEHYYQTTFCKNGKSLPD